MQNNEAVRPSFDDRPKRTVQKYVGLGEFIDEPEGEFKEGYVGIGEVAKVRRYPRRRYVGLGEYTAE